MLHLFAMPLELLTAAENFIWARTAGNHDVWPMWERKTGGISDNNFGWFRAACSKDIIAKR
jgi:hypothetical protein